ncbi:TOMM precursor leader peptide-binding protein [Nonomuraea insulae]|uniref:TOMM leader peptide-binding protein n=1 Tax=Nonomuraea insulae TaxID=1616787 RepID=A0ABW1CLI8_9ACTN
MSDRLVVGAGPLPAALSAQVAAADALVVAADEAGGPFEASRARGLPWLPVRVDAGDVLIGPAVHAGEPGCPTCVERRREGNLGDARAKQRSLTEMGRLLIPLAASLVTALMAEEAACGFARTRDAVLRVSLRTGAITRHRLLADSLCPDCAEPAEDRPARLGLTAAPKPAPDVFRTRALPAELRERYVDAETGVIGSVGVTGRGGLPVAVARIAPGRGGEQSRHGYGRAHDYRSAAATAIAEALERYASVRPRGRRTVKACFADVADQALDPRTLGLYPDDWYDRPGFVYRRFDPDQKTRWVWGYSFAAERPLLVPLSFAYYGAEPGWAFECSNGAALGGCLTEAIFYGLLEVAERDAFLMTWYGKLPVPKVDLDSVTDRRIPVTVERARRMAGYELSAFAMVMEQGVPAFWAMAVDRDGLPGRPYALCAAGAHPDPEQALRSALFELLPSIGALGDRYDADASADMLADGDRVRKMEHHRQLYCHPGAFARLAFLPIDGPGLPFAEATDARPGPGGPARVWPKHDDLADDATELVRRYLATGLDVVAVDTTCPELRAGGLASAKVLVPGTLPMTFGHRYRRTHGLERPLTVPRLLGYRDRDLAPADLTPDPHPFP